MSLSEIFNTAKSGLNAAQAGLRTNSQNIANVGTEGYARERVDQFSNVTAGRGTGVMVGESSRVADRFLEQSVYLRSGDMGRAGVTASYLDRMQALMGEPGSPSSLPARLDAISSSAIEMTGAQRSPQLAANFIANVDDAIRTMKQIGSDLDTLRGNAEAEVGDTVTQINGLLQRIHSLNDDVAKQQALGRSSAGPEGQRMSAIEELSGLVNITTRVQPNGKINIDAANGAALVDGRPRQLSYAVNGDAAALPSYPAIEIRFAGEAGEMGPATGERLDTAAVGGKLGGLLELRDGTLPGYKDVLGGIFSGLSETLNEISNRGTAFPAPNTLEGRSTGLVGSDRLGFTGNASVAILEADGSLVVRSDIDFDAFGAGATVDDIVAKIDADLGGAGTASFIDGRLVISATNSSEGVSIGQGVPASERAGSGFSHFFGMNDIVRSETSSLVASGFIPSDAHGFAAGQSANLELRDGSGRLLGSAVVDGAGGPTFGDIINDLNSGPLGAFGQFGMDDRGRVAFAGKPGFVGTSISIPTDTTDRLGTGRSFSALSGLNGQNSGLNEAGVRDDLVENASRLPLAELWDTTFVGARALGSGDTKVANAFVARLSEEIDFGKFGKSQLDRFSSLAMGEAGAQAAHAKELKAEASARREDAVNRRDSYAGVNLDEELSQMVNFQNSYAASARVMTTATRMYDTLLNMVD